MINSSFYVERFVIPYRNVTIETKIPTTFVYTISACRSVGVDWTVVEL